jgi:hypothetical protein
VGVRLLQISLSENHENGRLEWLCWLVKLMTVLYCTGANVILTTGGIDDLCLKYFVEAGAMAVR